MNSDARYTHKPGIIETDLEDELVLLDPTNQAMFGLNASGRHLWFALPEKTFGELVTSLCEHFEVSPEEAAGDAEELVQALLGAGLLEQA